MSNVLKISGPIKVGSLASAPANPEVGYIYYDSTAGKYQQYDGTQFVETADFSQLSSNAAGKGASLIGVEDAGNKLTATTVEGALIEIVDKADLNASNFAAHTNTSGSKHDAANIGYTNATKTNIKAGSTDVDASLLDLDNALGDLTFVPANYANPVVDSVSAHLQNIDAALATAGSNEFGDDVFRITGNLDATKKLAFQVDGLTTNTTRTITMPDSDINLGDILTNNAKVSADGSVTTHSDVTDAGSGIIISAAERTDIGNNKTHALGDGSDHADVAAHTALSGEAAGATNHGTFTGTTIPDASTTHGALQALETAVETKANDSAVVKLAGSTMDVNANLTFNGGEVLGLPAVPSAADSAASKSYVDATRVAGRTIDNLAAASTANIDLATGGLLTIDGVALSAGDRVLVKDQTNATENGVYVAAAGAWSRSSDLDNAPSGEIYNGILTAKVLGGTVNGGNNYIITSVGTGANGLHTIGTDNITWSLFSTPTTLTAGDGIDATQFASNVVQVDTTALVGDGIASDGSNNFTVKLDGTTLAKGPLGLKVNSISNTEISATAAIDATKIADGSVTNTEFQYIGGLTSDAQTQINSKIGALIEDTTPALGGDLTLGAHSLIHDANGMKRGPSAANFVEEEYIHAETLAANTTVFTTIASMTFDKTVHDAMEVVFKIKNAAGDIQIGTMRIISGSTPIINIVSTETAAMGISFQVLANGNNIEVQYKNTSASAGTMRMDLKRFLV